MSDSKDKEKDKSEPTEDTKLIQTTSWHKPPDATKAKRELERIKESAAEKREKKHQESTKKDSSDKK